MQPVGEFTQLGEARAQLGEDFIKLRSRPLGQLALGRATPNLELEGGRDEPLLGAVMQVALDLPTGSVGGVDDSSA
jgi:hypothetical protein